MAISGYVITALIVLVIGYAASETTGLVIASLMVAAATYFIIYSYESNRRKVRKLIKMHRKELAIKKAQLTIPASYGIIDESLWHKEIDHFIRGVV